MPPGPMHGLGLHLVAGVLPGLEGLNGKGGLPVVVAAVMVVDLGGRGIQAEILGTLSW